MSSANGLGRAALVTATALAALAALVTYVKRSGRKAFPTPSSQGAIIISGASTGIGRHAAESLAVLGYTVYAGVRNDRDAAEVKSAHKNIHALHLDISKSDSIEAALARVTKDLKAQNIPLIGLVNNAGITYALPIEVMDLDELRKVLEVNVIGTVALTQAFLPLIRRSQGRILIIGSILGFTVAPLYGAYSASKFALNAITDALRLEVSPWNISVSLIEPCSIKTKIQEKVSGSNAAHLKLSPERYSLYKHWFDLWDEAAKEHEKETVADLSLTSDAIIHALIDAYPLTRYTLGGFGGIPFTYHKLLLPFIPDRVQDSLKSKNVKV